MVYYEFEPSTAEDPTCRGDDKILNPSKLKRPPVGGVWNLGEGDASSGVNLVNESWFKITRYVVKSLGIAE
ncbi:hypothetical protein TNCV_4611761 [Trichonephila clavipes]|nr:hypothetical protein TNCV_4611761 [Trichonephila clavipes]